MGRKGVLLAGGFGHHEAFQKGSQSLGRQFLVILEIFHELFPIHHGVAVETGRIELHRSHHVGTGGVLGLEVIHSGVEVEFPLDGMGRNGVGNLAGGVLVLLGHIGQHAPEERHIHGLAAVENFIKGFL